MISLDGLLTRVVSGIKKYISFSEEHVKEEKRHASLQSLQQIKERVGSRTPHRKGIDLDQYGTSRKWLYRLGFFLVLSVLALSLALFVFEGDFHREWINPYAAASHGATTALDSNEIAVGLFGTMGVPPFVIYISLGVMLFGWWLMLLGLQVSSPLASMPFFLMFFGQLWLLWAGVPTKQLLHPQGFVLDIFQLFQAGRIPVRLAIPLGFVLLHMVLCWVAWWTRARASWMQGVVGLLHLALLGGFALLLLNLVPTRMDLMLGLSAAQLATLVMLVLFWYLLGRDALDGTVTLGHWYGNLGLRFLGSVWLTVVTLGLLAFGAIPYLQKSPFYGVFGSIVLLGVAVVSVQWVLARRAPDLMAVNVLLLSLVVLLIAPKAIAALFPSISQKKAFFFLSPVFLYIYSTILGFYSSAPLIVNRAGARFPREGRLFAHIGWVMLASNCLMFFVAARDDMFMLLSSQITAEAFLAVGIPFFLYHLLHKPKELLIQPLTPENAPHSSDSSDSSAPAAISGEEAAKSAGRDAHGNAGAMASANGAHHVQEPEATGDGKVLETLPVSGTSWRLRLAYISMACVLLLLVQVFHGLAVVTYARVGWHTAKGNLALRKNHYRQAIGHYNDAIGVVSSNYKPYALQAAAYHMLGERKEAIAALKRAVEIQPKAVDAWLQLGGLYRETKQYQRALAAYKRALALDSQDSFAYRNIALCYAYLKKFSEAHQQLDMALHLMPGNNEFGNNHYATRGFLFILANRHQEALAPLQKALSLNPRDHLALYDLSLVYERLKQFPKAIDFARKAHRLRPEQLSLLQQYVHLLMQWGSRDAKGRKELYKALFYSRLKSPDDRRITTYVLRTFFQLRNYKSIETQLQKLLAKHPEDAEYRLFRAQLWIEQKKFAQAKQELLALRPKHPTHARIVQHLAELAFRTKQLAEAKVLLQQLLQLEPKNRYALSRTAYLYLISKQPLQAYQIYQKMLKIHPQDGPIRSLAGRIAVQQLKRFSEGFQHYHILLHKKPDTPHPSRILALRFYGLSAIRLRPPKADVAISAYQRILALTQGKDFGALSNLSIIYGSTRNYPKQAEILDHLIKLRPQMPIFGLQYALALRNAKDVPNAIAAFSRLYQTVRAIPPATYNRVYRAQMRGFSQRQILAYCASSIRNLRKQNK